MIGRAVKQFSSAADDSVKWWMHQIDRGIKLRKEEEKRWEHNESFEDLKQWDGAFGSDDEVTVNKVGSWIRSRRASLSYKNPRAKVTPKTTDGWEPTPVPVMGPDGTPKIDPMTGQVEVRMVQKHKVREALLNNITSNPMFGLRKTISRLIKAGSLGYGVLKVGYRPEFETAYSENDPEQKVKITPDGIDFSGYLTNPVTGQPVLDDDGNLIDRTKIPAHEDWFIDWTHYRHMIIDPDGGNDYFRHCWVAQEYVRSLEDVKNDPLFKNTKDLEATGSVEDTEETGALDERADWLDDDVRDKVKQVRLFEIWDFKNDRLIVLADGHGKMLRDEPIPVGSKYGPFVMYRPNEIIGEDEKFYPRPPVSDLAPINDEYNKARQQQLRAMKKSNRKILTKEGALDTINLERLTNNRDMEVVRVKVDGNYGIGDALVQLSSPPVNDALYRNIDQISQDFDEVGGMPGEDRGVASSNTATGVNRMAQGAGSRLSFDRDDLAECLREAFKKLDDSIEANMTIERAIQIMGEDGQAFTAIIDADMIAGDFDVDIDIEDMIPVDSAQQAALKVQMMQIAGQSPWLFSDEELAIGWCKEFGMKDINFAKALSRQAQQQMQALMAPSQPMVPEAPPPMNEADAMAQTGAGMQAPNMQGAA
jgi:hypothetical protein